MMSLLLTFYYLVDNATSLKLLIPKHLSRHLFTVKWHLSSTFSQLLDALHGLYLSYLTCSALLAFTLMASPFSFCSCTSFLPPPFSVLPLPSPTNLCHFNLEWFTPTRLKAQHCVLAQHHLLANPVSSCM